MPNLCYTGVTLKYSYALKPCKRDSDSTVIILIIIIIIINIIIIVMFQFTVAQSSSHFLYEIFSFLNGVPNSLISTKIFVVFLSSFCSHDLFMYTVTPRVGVNSIFSIQFQFQFHYFQFQFQFQFHYSQ